MPSSAELLGANHNLGNHPVVTWFDPRCFLATFRWNGARSSYWQSSRDVLQTRYVGLRCRHLCVGIILRSIAVRSQRLSIRWSHVGDCAAPSSGRIGLASCFPPIRRSLHRNRNCTPNDSIMAGEQPRKIRIDISNQRIGLRCSKIHLCSGFGCMSTSNSKGGRSQIL